MVTHDIPRELSSVDLSHLLRVTFSGGVRSCIAWRVACVNYLSYRCPVY